MPTDQYLVYEARSNYAGKPVLKINVDGVPVVVPPQLQVKEPMISNVLQKAHRVQQDTEQQEAIFKQYRLML